MATWFDYTLPGVTPVTVRPALVVAPNAGNRRIDNGDGTFTNVPRSACLVVLMTSDAPISGLNGETSFMPIILIDNDIVSPPAPEAAAASAESSSSSSSSSSKSKG